jgi:hypothetical protein
VMTAVAVGIVALVVMPARICFVERLEEHEEPRKRSLPDVPPEKPSGSDKTSAEP